MKKGMRDHKAKLLGHHRQELSFLFSFEMLLNVIFIFIFFFPCNLQFREKEGPKVP